MKHKGAASFPNHVIDKIETAFYTDYERMQQDLVIQHRKLYGLAESEGIVIRYKSLIRSSSIDSVQRAKIQKVHPDLEGEAEKIIQSLDNFTYDMDKLRNFLSYLVRFSLTDETINEYIPSYFTEGFSFRELRYTKILPPDNIKSKFEEEINILHRYYLLVRFKEME